MLTLFAPEEQQVGQMGGSWDEDGSIMKEVHTYSTHL